MITVKLNTISNKWLQLSQVNHQHEKLNSQEKCYHENQIKLQIQVNQIIIIKFSLSV